MSRNTKIAILKNKIKIDLDTPYIQEKGDLWMLHRVMIKATPLHDVAGRVDYISSPDRQEHLVYADKNCADTEFWKQLSEHCQKSAPGKRACEGRELIIPLPNEFSKKNSA